MVAERLVMYEDHVTKRLHLRFRPDIEGLRALAIILVVGSHANIPFMSGGFSGVDVFFVLSGYLISGLLMREIMETGSLGFIAFYSRRLKRLLPALLLVTLVTILATAIILSPYEQVSQATTASLVPYWITNLFFSYSDMSYFSDDSASNLFLHTWSLAVEEQFYLVWPLLVFLVFKSTVGGQDGLFTQRLARIFTLVLAGSFLLCIFLSVIMPLWGFYLMPSRSWQFALGGLCFIVGDMGRVGKLQLGSNVLFGFAAIGLCLVLLGMILLHEDMVYPGYWSLIPSLGAAGIILGGTGSGTPIGSLLSRKPMLFVGKVSYSWYLWHWPVLMLGNMLFPEGGILLQMVLVVLSFLLAVVTLYTVEMPLRHNSTLVARPAVTVVLSLVFMSVGFAIAKLWQVKAIAWANTSDQVPYQQVRSELPVPYERGCDDWVNSAKVKICNFGVTDAENVAVLFGDSIAVQWFAGLAIPLTLDNWQFYVITKSACPIVDEPIFYSRIGQEYKICEEWRNAAIEQLQEINPDILFVGSASDYAYTPGQWQEGTQRIVEQLADSADRVYLIPGTYRLPFDAPSCLARKDWQPAFIASLSECSAQGKAPADAVVIEALTQAAREYPNVGVLDLNPIVCPDNHCEARREGNIVYRDFQHVSNDFVERSIGQIVNRMERVQFDVPVPQ